MAVPVCHGHAIRSLCRLPLEGRHKGLIDIYVYMFACSELNESSLLIFSCQLNIRQSCTFLCGMNSIVGKCLDKYLHVLTAVNCRIVGQSYRVSVLAIREYRQLNGKFLRIERQRHVVHAIILVKVHTVIETALIGIEYLRPQSVTFHHLRERVEVT